MVGGRWWARTHPLTHARTHTLTRPHPHPHTQRPVPMERERVSKTHTPFDDWHSGFAGSGSVPSSARRLRYGTCPAISPPLARSRILSLPLSGSHDACRNDSAWESRRGGIVVTIGTQVGSRVVVGFGVGVGVRVRGSPCQLYFTGLNGTHSTHPPTCE